jgi:hypothetical protein
MAKDKVILKEAKKVTSSALENKQFYFVTLSSTDTLELATTGSIAYPLENTPKSEEYGTFSILGLAKVLCTETIEPGERVAPASTGKAQKWVAGQYAAGVALEKGENGQIITIIVPAPPKA